MAYTLFFCGCLLAMKIASSSSAFFLLLQAAWYVARPRGLKDLLHVGHSTIVVCSIAIVSWFLWEEVISNFYQPLIIINDRLFGCLWVTNIIVADRIFTVLSLQPFSLLLLVTLCCPSRSKHPICWDSLLNFNSSSPTVSIFRCACFLLQSTMTCLSDRLLTRPSSSPPCPASHSKHLIYQDCFSGS